MILHGKVYNMVEEERQNEEAQNWYLTRQEVTKRQKNFRGKKNYFTDSQNNTLLIVISYIMI
jgi:hypothetical protein